MRKFCNQDSDTLSSYNNSVTKYKVVFTSEGRFIDPKNDLIRLCNFKTIKKENYTVELLGLNNPPDSLRTYLNGSPCPSIKTCLVNSCLGEALEDSIVNIQSESAFWSSCVSAQQIKFPKHILISGTFNSINNENTFQNPSIISYQSGKYLIADVLLVTQSGIQMDSGFVLTFYLERMD